MCIYVITYVKRKSQKMKKSDIHPQSPENDDLCLSEYTKAFLHKFKSISFDFFSIPLKVKILPCPNNCLLLPRKMGSIISNLGYMN